MVFGSMLPDGVCYPTCESFFWHLVARQSPPLVGVCRSRVCMTTPVGVVRTWSVGKGGMGGVMSLVRCHLCLMCGCRATPPPGVAGRSPAGTAATAPQWTQAVQEFHKRVGTMEGRIAVKLRNQLASAGNPGAVLQAFQRHQELIKRPSAMKDLAGPGRECGWRHSLPAFPARELGFGWDSGHQAFF